MGNTGHGEFDESVHLSGFAGQPPEPLALAAVCVLLHRELERTRRELDDTRRLAGQLQQALDSRILIEQAKGSMSARLDVTPEDAFELLRSYARARSLPLPRVAAEVLNGATLGRLPDHQR